MTKLSTGTVLTLQPIIEAIDNELAKEQPDRLALRIDTDRVSNIKNLLAAYKSQHRARDWNGKFWMNKKKDHLEISFAPPRSLTFTVKVADAEETHYTINSTASVPTSGPLLEMTDKQILEHILTESPQFADFHTDFLSPESKAFLAGTAEQTPLFIMLDRRGYKHVVPSLHRLHVSR